MMRAPAPVEPIDSERFLLVDMETGEEHPPEWLELEPAFGYDQDLIPDPGAAPKGERPDEFPTLDQKLQELGIVEAYRRWCGKTQPKVGNKTEGIKVSCPFPGHEDNDPSTWLNSDKNVGNCALCGGFDTYDLWAMTHGYTVPGYRTSHFPDVRRGIATELGLALVKTVAGEHVQELPDEDDLAAVVELSAHDDFEAEEEEELPHGLPIDWRALLDPAESAFLYSWMEHFSTSDIPDEFLLWAGLLGIGLATGNRITLHDRSRVRANLLICTLGPSGVGKTAANELMLTLLADTLPFRIGTDGGVRILRPQSAEMIHSALLNPVLKDGSDAETDNKPVTCLVNAGELSEMLSRSSRRGSTLKEALMELYDSPRPWGLEGRSNPLPQAEGHFVSALTTTQRLRLSSLLDSRDNDAGFTNRWIWATGIPKQPLGLSDPLEPCHPELREGIKTIHRHGLLHPGTRRWEPAAEAAWLKFFRRELAQYRDGSNEESDTFTRGELALKKLILLFAIDSRSDVITERHVKQAISLWPYLKTGYAFVAGESVATAEVKLQDELQERIIRLLDGRMLTAADIKKRITKNLVKRLGGLKAIETQLRLLVNLEMVKPYPTTRATYYHLPSYTPPDKKGKK